MQEIYTKQYILVFNKLDDWISKRNLYRKCNMNISTINSLLKDLLNFNMIEMKEEKASNNRIVIYYKRLNNDQFKQRNKQNICIWNLCRNN